jgi:hypothetical protein
MNIKISKGNTKIGEVANLSLPPVKTCEAGLPCHEDCYAKRTYDRWDTVRNAWDNNLKMWKRDPDEFERQVIEWIHENKPCKFRWHVGGDIIDQSYLNMIIRVAINHKDTKFLVYTKKHHLDFSRTFSVENLTVVLSMWPGMDDIPDDMMLPKAWLISDEYQMPDEYFRCTGKCDECGVCWKLTKLNLDVAFKKH